MLCHSDLWLCCSAVAVKSWRHTTVTFVLLVGAQVEWRSSASGRGGSPDAARPWVISVVSVPPMFILGLRLKGQHLPGKSSSLGSDGGKGKNTYLHVHISSLCFVRSTSANTLLSKVSPMAKPKVYSGGILCLVWEEFGS